VIELINANSIAIPLADKSVHLSVCSPPYFGLRAYGAGDGEIGSEPTPEDFIAALVQVGREVWRVLRDDAVWVVNLGDSYATSRNDHVRGGWGDESITNHSQVAKKGNFVPDGLQSGDRMNIPHRVAAALQADGWLWRDTIIWRKKSAMPESVNGWRWERCRVKTASLYNDENPHPSKRGDGVNYQARTAGVNVAEWSDCPGCDKCADTDGLILRRGSWRTTTAHEYIFVFAKQSGYFADREAVKTGYSREWGTNNIGSNNRWVTGEAEGKILGRATDPNGGIRDTKPGSGANPRDVMTFKPTPWKGAHYATFPTTLPEFFIRAYTSEAGVCAECGAPFARVVDVHKGSSPEASNEHRKKTAGMGPGSTLGMHGNGTDEWEKRGTKYHTLGFRRTCSHDAPAVPAIVLDPFFGSGSTGVAARKLGRSCIGLDLSLVYLREQARERLGLNAVRAWTNGRPNNTEVNLKDLPLFKEQP